MEGQIDQLLNEADAETTRALQLPAARGARSRGAAHPRRGPAHGRARRGGHPRGEPGPRRHTMRRWPWTSSRGDAIINEAQRGVSRLIAVTIATQAAGRARPPLPPDPRPRDLRARADGRPRGVGGEGGHQARARSRRSHGYLHLPEMAERAAVLVHGVLRALVDSDAVKARQIAADDDEIDRLYHATFDEVVELMRAGPGQRRARDADHHRVALPRADRRPGDEHRRGRGLSRDRRRRGPQSVTADGVARRRSGCCSCAPATRPGASWPRRCSGQAAGRPLRGPQRRHRAEGDQPADPPRPRRGRHRRVVGALEVGHRVPRPGVRLRRHRVRPGARELPGTSRARSDRSIGNSRTRRPPKGPRTSASTRSARRSTGWRSDHGRSRLIAAVALEAAVRCRAT